MEGVAGIKYLQCFRFSFRVAKSLRIRGEAMVAMPGMSNLAAHLIFESGPLSIQ